MNCLEEKRGGFKSSFFNNDDHSRILVFFNGAVGPDQQKNGFAFQRWTWASKFRHPVLIISDPATYGENGLPLGWYVGKKTEYYLDKVLGIVIDALQRFFPQAMVVSFGSSAGGFAALSGLHHGYFDQAIIVNPQTDIQRYQPQSSVARFLNYYGGDSYVPDEEDRKRFSVLDIDMGKVRSGSEVIYIQNTFDKLHLENHMKPYDQYMAANPCPIRYKLVMFSDEALGHNPPALERLVEIAGEDFGDLLI